MHCACRNALRTVEDDAFEGLDAVETLRLRDNILGVPASALDRLPLLRTLSLDYNRLDLLRAVSERAGVLGLVRNVIRELSPSAFRDFTLQHRLAPRSVSATGAGHGCTRWPRGHAVGARPVRQPLRERGRRRAAGDVAAVPARSGGEPAAGPGPRAAGLSGLPALEELNLSGYPLLAPTSPLTRIGSPTTAPSIALPERVADDTPVTPHHQDRVADDVPTTVHYQDRVADDALTNAHHQLPAAGRALK